MTARGMVRYHCRIGTRRFADDGAVVRWCLTHDDHAGHAREPGEIGADPADVPRISDLVVTDAEEQYAGRLPTAPTGDRHNSLADAAYRILRDPQATEQDRATARGALTMLRAQADAAARTWTDRPILLPMGAECATCHGLVMRTARLQDEYVVVSPWRHVPDPDVMPYDHPVTRVAFPA